MNFFSFKKSNNYVIKLIFIFLCPNNVILKRFILLFLCYYRDMSNDNNYEYYIADNIKELLQIRIKRLQDEEICRRVLKNKPNANKIKEEIIDKKAKGLSSAIKSSLGFWQQETTSLNSWILSRYYALLQITIAEQVSDLNNSKDLSQIQKATAHGHGLNTVLINENDISTFSIYLRTTGYFKTYLEHLGYKNTKYLLEISPSKMIEKIEENKNNVISLFDLFRRLPELAEYIKEYIGLPPLSFHIGHSIKNDLIAEQIINKEVEEGKFPRPIFEARVKGETYIDFYTTEYDAETMQMLIPVLSNITFVEAKDNYDKDKYIGLLKHESEHWQDEFPTHKSSYCGSSYIVPVWEEINNIIAIHFLILYGLSIIVRYYPNLWYEIERGKYSYLIPLLEHYLIIFDNTVPQIMLSKITGKRIHTTTPDSIFAPM